MYLWINKNEANGTESDFDEMTNDHGEVGCGQDMTLLPENKTWGTEHTHKTVYQKMQKPSSRQIS